MAVGTSANSCNGLPRYEVCLDYIEATNTYTLTTNLGNLKTGIPAPKTEISGEVVVVNDVCYLDLFCNKIPASRIPLTQILSKINVTPAGGFNSENCSLVISVGGNTSDPIPMRALLEKYKVQYNAAQHSLQCIINGAPFGDPQLLNCGEIDVLINEAGQCILRYVDEKSNQTDRLLPQIVATHDPIACTLTLNDLAKPLAPALTVELGAPSGSVGLDLDDNCDLVLCYKDRKITVPLPNFVTNVIFNSVNCTATTTYWKGDPVTVPYLDAISLEKQPDGSALLTVKGTTCAILPPADPDGRSEQGVVLADGTDGNGNAIVDFAGNPISPGTQTINYYNSAGDYVNSKDCTELFAAVSSSNGSVSISTTVGAGGIPTFDLSAIRPLNKLGVPYAPTDTPTFLTPNDLQSEVLLRTECNINAAGEACPGVITFVHGNPCTGEVTRRVDKCTTKLCEQWITRYDVTGVGGTVGGTILSPAIEAGLDGQTVELYGDLTFNMPKAGDVEFVGTHQWFAGGVNVNGLFEMQLDGANWFSPSGGTNDIFGDIALEGAAEWPIPEYRCLKNLTKGEHTIRGRFTFLTVLFDPSALKRLSGTISDFSVNLIEDQCNEVIL